MHVQELEPYFENHFWRNQKSLLLIINNKEEYEVEQGLDKWMHYEKKKKKKNFFKLKKKKK